MNNPAQNFNIPPAIASANSFPETDWQTLLANSITSLDQLASHLPVDREALARVTARYPLRIHPYTLALIRQHREPLQRQVIPCVKEGCADNGQQDPLHEEQQSPVDGIIHRYPDRVVFLVSNRCAVYCRFCMRKRQVGQAMPIGWETLQQGIDYIRATTGIRDVILSGGDPLLRTDEQVEWLLARLRAPVNDRSAGRRRQNPSPAGLCQGNQGKHHGGRKLPGRAFHLPAQLERSGLFRLIIKMKADRSK